VREFSSCDNSANIGVQNKCVAATLSRDIATVFLLLLKPYDVCLTNAMALYVKFTVTVHILYVL